jgi:hypothetical protein
MRKNQFRPTLGDALEVRIVPAAHVHAAVAAPHAVLTTNTYHTILVGIDNEFSEFKGSRGNAEAVRDLENSLINLARRVPFGNQNLVPQIPGGLVGLTKGNADQVKAGVKDGLKTYIGQSLAAGTFAFLQSRVHWRSDNDFPRSGKV